MTAADRLPALFAAVRCPACRARLASCPTTATGFPLARERFDVGNISSVQFGHQMFHTRTGRTALCVAREQPTPNGA